MVIQGSTTLRIREWCSNSALFTTAWGFGFILVLGLFVFAVITALVDITHSSSPRPVYHWGLPQWLWSFVGAAAGLFPAGFAAYSFVKSRPRGRVGNGLVLATLAFALAFPFTSVAFTALLEIELGDGRVDELLEGFQSHWWEAFRTFGILYLLLIGSWSAIAVSVPRPNSDMDRRGSGAIAHADKQEGHRFSDLVVGLLFIALGIAVGLITWSSQTDYALQIVTKSSVPELQAYAQRVQSEVWSVAALGSMPFLIAGGILLMPFGRFRRW